MELIEVGGQYTKKEIYAMTRSAEIKKMSDNVDTEIHVGGYVIYTDTNGKGDEVTVLSVMDKDGEVFATNSATARREFEYIADLMDGDDFTIKIVSGESKNGRTYITVTLI